MSTTLNTRTTRRWRPAQLPWPRKERFHGGICRHAHAMPTTTTQTSEQNWSVRARRHRHPRKLKHLTWAAGARRAKTCATSVIATDLIDITTNVRREERQTVRCSGSAEVRFIPAHLRKERESGKRAPKSQKDRDRHVVINSQHVWKAREGETHQSRFTIPSWRTGKETHV